VPPRVILGISNRIIYVKGRGDIFGINSREQGFSLLLTGTLQRNIAKARQNLFIANKEVTAKVFSYQRNVSLLLPPEVLNRTEIRNHVQRNTIVTICHPENFEILILI